MNDKETRHFRNLKKKKNHPPNSKEKIERLKWRRTTTQHIKSVKMVWKKKKTNRMITHLDHKTENNGNGMKEIVWRKIELKVPIETYNTKNHNRYMLVSPKWRYRVTESLFPKKMEMTLCGKWKRWEKKKKPKQNRKKFTRNSPLFVYQMSTMKCSEFPLELWNFLNIIQFNAVL